MRTIPRAYGLVPFRLTDIPLDLRDRAATKLARRADAAFDPEQAGAAGLLAALTEQASFGKFGTDPEQFKRAARTPSDRVYWIPRPAWETVMGVTDADAA